jgi:hypothetical protein
VLKEDHYVNSETGILNSMKSQNISRRNHLKDYLQKKAHGGQRSQIKEKNIKTAEYPRKLAMSAGSRTKFQNIKGRKTGQGERKWKKNEERRFRRSR